MNKYLLIGSAPYIKDWYSQYGSSLLDAGFKLCAMNNAWAIDPLNLWLWLYPSDFFQTGTLIPTSIQRLNFNERKFRHWIRSIPYDYERGKGSGTMILNSLVYLLNRSVKSNEQCVVAIAGSDCVYKKGDTHFYGKGSPDSIRYGKEWLVEELKKVSEFFYREQCEIYNVGGQEATLLPYVKIGVEDLLVREYPEGGD